MRDTKLGDFGAGGPRSAAGDTLIDTEQRATEAASGQWEYEAHTDTMVGWHIPGTPKTLLLKRKTCGWQLRRANRPVGTRDTLAEGLDLAENYMTDRPEGSRR
jgi:hypothetical protein